MHVARGTVCGVVLAMAIIGTSSLSHAQDSATTQDPTEVQTTRGAGVSIEIDPLVFAVARGVGGHLSYRPKFQPKLVIGLSMAARIRMPDFFTNLSSKNEGWSARVNQGLGIFGEYYFSRPHEGEFISLQLLTQELEVQHKSVPGEVNATNTVAVLIAGGYSFRPFKHKGIYIKPWAGVGYQGVVPVSLDPDRVTADTQVGDKTYHVAPLVAFTSVHLGYSF